MMKLPRTRGINTNRRAYDNHIRVSFLSFTPRLHQYRDHGCNLQNHDQPTEYRSTTPPRYLAVDRLKNLEKTSIFSREEFFKSSRSVRIEKQPCTIGVNSYWFNRFPIWSIEVAIRDLLRNLVEASCTHARFYILHRDRAPARGLFPRVPLVTFIAFVYLH